MYYMLQGVGILLLYSDICTAEILSENIICGEREKDDIKYFLFDDVQLLILIKHHTVKIFAHTDDLDRERH